MNFTECNPQGINKADIVVGIPSYNEASSISLPTKQADIGLTKYYSHKTAVIINCDNASPDGTTQAFFDTETKTPKMSLTTEPGIVGKGYNLRNLFQKAVELSAKAIIVLDADVKNVTPQWIRNLCEPLFDDYHFVAPLYVRHKYDGSFTNNLVYPMTRALYGRRVRQPVGGEVGFSGETAKLYLDCEYWDENVGQFGINLWMTTLAVKSPGAVIQSFMGKTKIHRVRDFAADIARMFGQVVTTLFELMVRFDGYWTQVKWSRPTAVFGFGVGEVEVPPPVDIDTTTLSAAMRAGMEKNRDFYKQCIAEPNFNKLEEVASLSDADFEFPTNLWARILFDFAVAYRNAVVPRDKLVDSLIPLYYAKTMSFVLDTEAMNTQQVEELVEDQCLQFEKAKPYLIERWSAR
jgi:glycosyltransferase involved in cell wall biosynthesis|uniref:Glycosyltransferase n=1 Tax=Desulfomonile tiedjei TaxID=2358 RepID=A0A7C4ATF9_9BACT